MFGEKGGTKKLENANASEASSADSIGETEAEKEENVEEAIVTDATLANLEEIVNKENFVEIDGNKKMVKFGK